MSFAFRHEQDGAAVAWTFNLVQPDLSITAEHFAIQVLGWNYFGSPSCDTINQSIYIYIYLLKNIYIYTHIVSMQERMMHRKATMTRAQHCLEGKNW